MDKKTIALFLALCIVPFAACAENETYPQNEFIVSVTTGIPNLHPHAAYKICPLLLSPCRKTPDTHIRV